MLLLSNIHTVNTIISGNGIKPMFAGNDEWIDHCSGILDNFKS